MVKPSICSLAVIILLATLLVGCGPRDDEVQIGELTRVSQVQYVSEPHIAVNPDDPDHLVAIVIEVSELDCKYDECRYTLGRYTSTDGGKSWKRDLPFGNDLGADGVVAFGPDGTLYTTGLIWPAPSPRVVAQSPEEQQTGGGDVVEITPLNSDKQWLTVDQESGELFVPYSGRTFLDSGNLGIGILLQRSTDKAETWSTATTIDEGVEITPTQVIPVGAQAMLGRDDNVAVAWIEGVDVEGSLAANLWLATSTDDGQTFSPPRTIAKTWGFITTAFHDGAYYVFHLTGDQLPHQLAVSVSRDDGTTWEGTVVSGKLPLYYTGGMAPGIGIAPDGTIDVVFYATDESTPNCLDVAERLRWAEEPWIDQCNYDVYYSFSRDSGRTFREPIRLNRVPIQGERFVRKLTNTGGTSWPGEYIGMASTEEYAYPIWIDTQGSEGTQAYTVRIGR